MCSLDYEITPAEFLADTLELVLQRQRDFRPLMAINDDTSIGTYILKYRCDSLLVDQFIMRAVAQNAARDAKAAPRASYL